MLVLKKIFNFIAKYHFEMNIERCGYKDGFIITVYKHGCNRSIFISDDRLLAYGEDGLLFVIEDMVHELIEEEQKCLKVAEQFKKLDITIEINEGV